VSFSAFMEQEFWFLVQGFEVRNCRKNYVCTVLSVHFCHGLLPCLIEMTKSLFSIWLYCFTWVFLAYFRDFGAKNVISEFIRINHWIFNNSCELTIQVSKYCPCITWMTVHIELEQCKITFKMWTCDAVWWGFIISRETPSYGPAWNANLQIKKF
jgi:hypothetical protein